MKHARTGRKLYSLGETYLIDTRALRSMPYLTRAKKRNILEDHFIRRLMLAVTEVNGCAMCSYAHAKMALESGMSAEEIDRLLAGDRSDTPGEELPAILFAQHYADSRGKPSKKAWASLVDRYGVEKSRAILAAVQTIMLGNAYGIPLGSMLGRLRGRAGRDSVDPRAGVAYSIAMLLSMVVILPAAFLQALAMEALRLPSARFV